MNDVTEKRAPRVPVKLMKPQDFLMCRYAALVPVSHTLTDVMHPEYFLNHVDELGRALKSGPLKIEVISDDYSLHAEFLVMEVTKGGVKLRIIAVHFPQDAKQETKQDAKKVHDNRKIRTRKENVPVISQFVADMIDSKQSGPKWRVMQNGEVVAKEIATKTETDKYVSRLNKGEMYVSDIPREYAVT